MKRITKKSAIIIALIAIVIISGGVTASIFIGGSGRTGEVNLEKGLVGQWKLDGNAKDSTPYANNGTVSGAVLTTDRKNQSNKAYSFNGTTDNISIATSTDFNFYPNSFSVSAWVNTGQTGTTKFFVSRADGIDAEHSKGFVLYLGTVGTVWSFGVWDGANNEIPTDSTNAAANTWYHVVGTWTASDTKARIYVNGVLKDTHTQALMGDFNYATNLLIGKGNTTFHQGSIDDVRIYNRALTQAEITALYNEYNPSIQVSDLQKGLVGQWKFDGNAKDSTPYANNGTVVATLTTDRKGQSSKAYSFNGSSNYIGFGNPAILNPTSNITVAAWVYPTAFATYKTIVGHGGTGATGDGYNLFLRSTQIVQFSIYDSAGNTRVLQTTSTVPLNAWSHIVGVLDGTTMKVYINGIQDVTTITSVSGIKAGTLNFNIGSYYNHLSDYFSGSIDDVRIYNRALTQTEITALYEEYNPAIQISDLQKGLVGNWKFDGNAKDSTPYQNNGTVSGAYLVQDRKGANMITNGNFVNGDYWTPLYGAESVADNIYSLTGDGSVYGPRVYQNTLITANSQKIYIRAKVRVTNSSCWSILLNVAGSTGGEVTVDSQVSPAANTWYTLDGIANAATLTGVVKPMVYNTYADAATANGKVMEVQDVSAYNLTAMFGAGKEPTAAWCDANLSPQYSKAYSFDGADDYIQMADSQQTRMTTGGTISAWIYPKGLGGGSVGRIIDKSTGIDASNGYALYITTNNILRLRISGGTNLNSSNNAITLNSWQHVLVTFSSSGRKLYVNGINVTANGDSETALPPDVAGVVRMGNLAYSTVYPFDGYIDDVRMYNRVLTQAEITALYNEYK